MAIPSRAMPFLFYMARFFDVIECLFEGMKNERRRLFLHLYMRSIGVKFGRCFYSRGIPYLYSPGNVVLGDFCSFGEFTKIWNFGRVEIGNDFVGAAALTILTGGHDPDTLMPCVSEVHIGDRVWIGAGVTIMPGVTIGDDVVIGAAALVSKSIPSGEIWVGVPARKLRDINYGKRSKSFFSIRSTLGSGI